MILSGADTIMNWKWQKRRREGASRILLALKYSGNLNINRLADELIGYKAHQEIGGLKVLCHLFCDSVWTHFSALSRESGNDKSSKPTTPPPDFKIWTGSLPDLAPAEGGTASFQQPPTTLPAKHCFSFWSSPDIPSEKCCRCLNVWTMKWALFLFCEMICTKNQTASQTENATRSPVASTTCYWQCGNLNWTWKSPSLKIGFWLILTETKQDSEPSVIFIGKFGPTALNFGLEFWAPAVFSFLDTL